MTDRQRARRLARIASRARLIERSPSLDQDDVVALERIRDASDAGARWVAFQRGVLTKERSLPRVRR